MNFLSIRFLELQQKLKVKRYKIFICIIWIISLSLFISLMYFNNLNKKLEKNINISNVKPVNKEEDKVVKKFGTMNNFIDFYDHSNNNEIFNEITVNENQLVLNSIIQDKIQYYSIIYDFEHSNKYNIVYLSPLSDYNDKYSFKLTLEVKK